MENDCTDQSEKFDTAELIDLGSALLETKGTFLGFNIELGAAAWWF